MIRVTSGAKDAITDKFAQFRCAAKLPGLGRFAFTLPKPSLVRELQGLSAHFRIVVTAQFPLLCAFCTFSDGRRTLATYDRPSSEILEE